MTELKGKERNGNNNEMPKSILIKPDISKKLVRLLNTPSHYVLAMPKFWQMVSKIIWTLLGFYSAK